MIFHELNNDGCPNAAGQLVREEAHIYDRKLHPDPSKTLYAFELDDDQNLVAVTGCTVEGKFYASGSYVDLSTGHDLSGAGTSLVRYLIRITPDAGSSIEDKHIRLKML